MKHHYISLGSACGVAFQLHRLKLKEYSLPFDWVQQTDISKLKDIIDREFDAFGEYSSLKFIKCSTKHRVLNKNNIPVGSTTDENNTSYVYKNIASCITFFHEFNHELVNEYDTSYLDFKEKYTRRFKRLHSLFESGDELILIRDEPKPHNINYNTLCDFLDYIESKLTNGTKMIFIFIIQNRKNKTFSWMKNLDKRIILVNDTGKYGGWTRSLLNWKQILNV